MEHKSKKKPPQKVDKALTLIAALCSSLGIAWSKQQLACLGTLWKR